MKERLMLISFIILIITISNVLSEEYPRLEIIKERPLTTIRTNDGDPLSPIVMQDKLTAYTEVAPTIIDNKIFISSGWTYSADYNPVDANFIQHPDIFKYNFLTTNKLIYGGEVWVDNSKNPKLKRSLQNNNTLSIQEFKNIPFWRATYGGIWEVEKINNKLFGIIHGEQGNRLINDICYQDNIHPDISCESCKYEPGIGDCPTSYSSFLSGGYSNNSDGTDFVDEGPIVWPADGYTDYNASGNSWDLGWGVRHGNSIIKDNYLYLFYQDWSGGDPKNGRGIGIKIARAPLSNLHAGYFETWYKLNNKTEGWDPSLPKEFWSGSFYVNGKNVWNENYKNTPQKWVNINGCKMWSYGNGWLDRGEKRGFQCFNNINDYSIKGGRSSCLFGDHYVDSEQHYYDWPLIYNENARYQFGSSFSVAKIKGTNYYLGVEDSAAGFDPEINESWFNYWVGLRISNDLIHWSEPIILEETIVSDWRDLRLGHPNLLSKDFKSNKEVDLDGFYIIGSHTSGDGTWRVQELNYKWLTINIIEKPEIKTCTSFKYSQWTQCNALALQSRKVLSSNPENCEGGNPRTIQQCSPPCLESNWQAVNSICNSSSILTKNWTKIGNCNETIGISKPSSETAPCTYNPNKIICNNFAYSNWSECQPNGIQKRILINSYPENCEGGNPILKQSCEYSINMINNPNDGDWSNNNYHSYNKELEINNDYQDEKNKEDNTDKEIVNPNKEENLTLKKIFIKFICKISNLFNWKEYEKCISSYT